MFCPFGMMTTDGNTGFRSDIQGLRALGVVSVITYHINADLLPSGYLGVDIFFVISGFVITSALAKRQFNSFTEFLLSFIAKRIGRLLPALVLCVAVTAFVGLAFIPPDSEYFKQSWKVGITALFGLSNVQMYRASLEYFGTPADFNLFSRPCKTSATQTGRRNSLNLLHRKLAGIEIIDAEN